MNPPASTASRTAWIMVLLLFPVALLNYLDRQMLATMQKSMVSDIPTITNEEAWGSVLAASSGPTPSSARSADSSRIVSAAVT